ncbi:MAG: FecR domain-containing protein [Odoribacteraceae bacterium]|jgi:ferric-dicitrate binding protein FerR (iron transport regulator)|nr:FecR domain-containing protein [Odoribacteraceae bacterium]
MNKKYENYDAAMFSTDNLFLDWRIMGDPAAAAFWEKFLEEHPDKQAEIDAATRVVSSARFNPVALTGDETRQARARLARSVTRRRRVRLAWGISTAACVLVSLFLALLLAGERQGNGLEEMVARARERKIRLVLADARVVELASNAVVACDSAGRVTVRDEGRDRPLLVAVAGESPVSRLVVPEGRHASLVLPDGSVAWVNARSTVEFPASFAGDRREIRASGEVYLRVVRDTGRPFVLHAPLFSVSVLGTRFNVTAYPDDDEQSVVLVDGSVSVALPAGFPVTLEPSERFALSGGRARVEQVNVAEYVSWKDGVLQFTGRPLPDVLNSLSRYYGVPIEYEGAGGTRLTGKLVLFDDLSTVLDNITVIAPLRYRVREQAVVVTLDER